MLRKIALALSLLAAGPVLAQQPFRTVQSSQDPTGPLGLLTNLNNGQEIDLINAPTSASQSFALWQTGNNNVRNLLFTIGTNGATFFVPINGVGGTSVLGFGAKCDGITDDTTAINNAITAATTGQNIIFPNGTCIVSGQLTVANNNVGLVGQGALIAGASAQTTIKSTSTTADVIHLNANVGNFQIQNLTIDGTGTQTAGAGVFIDNGNTVNIRYVTVQDRFNGFSLGATSYSVCDHCIAQNNFNHGFNLFNSAAIITQQWYLDSPLSQNNNGWGYFSQATATGSGIILGSWTGPVSFANTLGGIGIFGVASNGVFDLFLNHPVLSSDGNDEIQLALFGGGNIRISDAFVEQAGLFTTGRGNATAASNIGHGIEIAGTTATAGSVLITGGQAYNNSQEGLRDDTQLQALTIVGFQSISNSVKVSGPGININHISTNTSITGSRSYNINFSSQTFGVLAANGGSVTLSGNQFGGNVTGSCSTTNGNHFVAAANSDQDGTCGGYVSSNNSLFQTNTNGGVVQTWQQTVGGATTPLKFWVMDNTGGVRLRNNAFSSDIIVFSDSGAVQIPGTGYIQPVAVAIASLPTCNGTSQGARMTISNGIASPTYQQAVSATGAAIQPVFCNGSGWIYD